MKNHIHPLYELPPAVLRGALEMRPGAFDANVKHLLGIFKSVAATGCKEIVLQDDAFRGGDCGSMQSHPVFIEREAKAKAKFLENKERPENKNPQGEKNRGVERPRPGRRSAFPVLRNARRRIPQAGHGTCKTLDGDRIQKRGSGIVGRSRQRACAPCRKRGVRTFGIAEEFAPRFHDAGIRNDGTNERKRLSSLQGSRH